MNKRPLVIILGGQAVSIALCLVLLALDHTHDHQMRIPVFAAIAATVFSMPFLVLRWWRVQKALLARRQHATAPSSAR